MTFQFLTHVIQLPGVLGTAILLPDRTCFKATGSLEREEETLHLCSFCIENEELNVLRVQDRIHRVIQRDSRHILAVSTRVGKQTCVTVYVTSYGRLVVHFVWNPPAQSEAILKEIEVATY